MNPVLEIRVVHHYIHPYLNYLVASADLLAKLEVVAVDTCSSSSWFHAVLEANSCGVA
jgi:hypothetical protein